MNQTDSRQLLQTAISAAFLGSAAIMEVYRTGGGDGGSAEVEYKADASPLTAADRGAHAAILESLRSSAPEIPVLSEEGTAIPYAERRTWEELWLVDPLDGTKEFIKRNGEFTVNIALIRGARPVLGVVHAPDSGLLYYAAEGFGAFRVDLDAEAAPAECSLEALGERARVLPCEPGAGKPVPDDGPLRIIASRSHMNEQTSAYIHSRREAVGAVELISAGSSLKICRVAEGSADEYPRFAPTMEWDTAAADAVARIAGCSVCSWPQKGVLVYNKEDLHNPHFLVTRERT